MTIPTVPTDSLYKFVALTGIIVTVVTLFYVATMDFELQNDIIELNGEIRKLNYEKGPIEVQTKELKKRIAELDKTCNCGFKSIVNDSMIVRPEVIKGPENMMALSKQIDALIDERNSLIEQLNVKSMAVTVKEELVQNKNRNLADLSDASLIIIPISMIFSGMGFSLWYSQTQWYQDSLLKQQYQQLHKFERCQSCAMHFSSDDSYNALTNEEKQKTLYCSACFKDGGFVEPDITLDQMKEKVKARCKELKFGSLATKIHAKRLSDLQRWRPRFKWN